MSLKEIGTIHITDAESGDEAVAIVRSDADTVGLCLSLETNGDVEVVLKKADAKKLAVMLQEAIRES